MIPAFHGPTKILKKENKMGKKKAIEDIIVMFVQGSFKMRNFPVVGIRIIYAGNVQKNLRKREGNSK
jgi:hypothetical protein